MTYAAHLADNNQKLDYNLILKIRCQDMEAKEALVAKYIPMVKHVTRKYYASFLDFEDLLQEGTIGLLNAIDEYKPEQYQVKFSSFAYICILRKVYNVIKQASGNKHKALNDALSLQTFINTEENRTIIDLIASKNDYCDPEFNVVENATNQYIEELLANHLSLLEYSVIMMLLRGYSCGEIESTIGVGAKVVDNARTRVKTKLKKLIKEYGSLFNPNIPGSVRKRKDLYLNLRG